ncbi:hypothetical protein EV182_004075, partial [Spiromyces aspiralis]
MASSAEPLCSNNHPPCPKPAPKESLVYRMNTLPPSPTDVFSPPKLRDRYNRSLSVGGELECREFFVRQIERYGLPALMNSPVGLSYFLAFLISEYNPECLLFIKAVESFRLTAQTICNKQQQYKGNTSSPAPLQARSLAHAPDTDLTTSSDSEFIHGQAMILWLGFISRSAPLEINIRADIRNAIRRTLESHSAYPTMFAAAANHLMNIVQDCFIRFRQSSLFASMLDDMRKYSGSKSSEEYGRRRASALVMDALVKTYGVRKRHSQLVMMLNAATRQAHDVLPPTLASPPTTIADTPLSVDVLGASPASFLDTCACPNVDDDNGPPQNTMEKQNGASNSPRLANHGAAAVAAVAAVDSASSSIEKALNKALTASSTSFALVAWVYQFSQRELGFPLPSYQEALQLLNCPYEEPSACKSYTPVQAKTTYSIPMTPQATRLNRNSLSSQPQMPVVERSQQQSLHSTLALDTSTDVPSSQASPLLVEYPEHQQNIPPE